MKDLTVKITTISLTLSLLSLFSCDSGDVSPGRMFVKEINDPSGHTDRFEYENGKLVTYKRFFGERLSTETTFEYQNNLLTTVSVHDNGYEYHTTLKYGPDNKKTGRTTVILLDGQEESVVNIDCTYDDSGNLISEDRTSTDSNSLPGRNEYEWENGNIVKVNFFNIDDTGKQFISSRSITYDSKRNYSNQDPAFSYIMTQGVTAALSRNNIVSVRDEFTGTILDRGNYELKYNKYGYPESYIYSVENDRSLPVQLTYE